MTPASKTENTLTAAETLFANGETEAARQRLQALVARDPVNAEALNDLGVIHFGLNDLVAAEDCLVRAVALDRGHVEAIRNLAHLFAHRGAWQQAAHYLKMGIDLDDNDIELHNTMARVCLQLGRIQAARGHMMRSLKLNPKQRNVRDALHAAGSPETPGAPCTPKPGSQKVPATPVDGQTAELQSPYRHPPLGRHVPTVTVGLAVYSAGKMLCQAIESILNQEFTDLELLVRDYGSDPDTPDTCRRYQRGDRRLRYVHSGADQGFIRYQDYLALAELASGPFFMWSSYDDIFEPAYVGRCLERLLADPTVALVYPRSRVMDQDGDLLGIANDALNAAQNDPLDRFRHLIRELGMCNAFFGLQRTSWVRQSQLLDFCHYVGQDNLYLAELALRGKIVQIDDVLFTRRLNRNYGGGIEQLNADVIRSHEPRRMGEGLTLPYCRFTYAHLELVNRSSLSPERKEILSVDIIECFRSRWHQHMRFEIERALALIDRSCFYCTWDNQTHDPDGPPTPCRDDFERNNLLRQLQEALFIYPEWSQLRNACERCRSVAAGGHLQPAFQATASTASPRMENSV